MNEDGALDPFPAPQFFSVGNQGLNSFDAPNLSGVLPVIYTIVFTVWAAYTIVIIYHWLRYGHRSFLAIPLLAIHVAISGFLLLMAASGLK